MADGASFVVGCLLLGAAFVVGFLLLGASFNQIIRPENPSIQPWIENS